MQPSDARLRLFLLPSHMRAVTLLLGRHTSYAQDPSRVVDAFVRRLCLRPLRARAVGRARRPSAAPHRRQPSRGHVERRGATASGTRPWRPGADEGTLPRPARPAAPGVVAARPPLRRTHAPQESGLCAGRRRHPRARHRRQRRDLHGRQRRRLTAAAVPGQRPHRAALAHAAADVVLGADLLAVSGQLRGLGGPEPVVRADGHLSGWTPDGDRTRRA